MCCCSTAPHSQGLFVASYDHQVMIFHEHISQSAPDAASVTQLCLHWCSAQLSAVLTFSPHWSQGLCVEADEAVFGELGAASCFHINWWCLMSILTCACIGLMNIWALYWNWAHMLLRFHCTSVTWSWAVQRIPSSADAVLWVESLTQQYWPRHVFLKHHHLMIIRCRASLSINHWLRCSGTTACVPSSRYVVK